MSYKFPSYFEKIILDLHDDGKSLHEIGRNLDKHPTSISRVIKRNGRVPHFNNKGSGHPGWKGGRGIKSGYWTVYNEDHPRKLNNGRVFEHILVAEKKLGRSISRKEPIHHIDFDRLNNDPDNLFICKSNSEHMKSHYSLEEVARELFIRGVLGFKDGVYFLK